MSSNPHMDLALLYTDMAGSTRLAAHLQSTYTSVQDKHNKIIRSLVQLHNGQVIEARGEGLTILQRSRRGGTGSYCHPAEYYSLYMARAGSP